MIRKRQVQIMGSSFYPGANNIIPRLKPGAQLRVEREPTNKYDPNAISVWFMQQQLGHLPRGFAAELAPLLDSGVTKLTVTKSRDPKFQLAAIVVAEWDDGKQPETDVDPAS